MQLDSDSFSFFWQLAAAAVCNARPSVRLSLSLLDYNSSSVYSVARAAPRGRSGSFDDVSAAAMRCE